MLRRRGQSCGAHGEPVEEGAGGRPETPQQKYVTTRVSHMANKNTKCPVQFEFQILKRFYIQRGEVIRFVSVLLGFGVWWAFFVVCVTRNIWDKDDPKHSSLFFI